jgi:two-component system, NarL family, nitrate/nitrite response regulator NarL
MAARILLVDDFQRIRTGIRSLLSNESLEICGEAANGREAVERVRELQPDLVLLDIVMPVMNGLDAAHEIHRIAPSTKIVFLTIEDSSQAAALASLAGADGLVSKAAAGRELIPTLRRLLQREN